MKTILIFLAFISLNGLGQEVKIIDLGPWTNELIEYWDKYSQECYNDSSFMIKCYCKDYRWDDSLKYMRLQWIEQECDRKERLKSLDLEWKEDTIWMHPNKPNFLEFIERLKLQK